MREEHPNDLKLFAVPLIFLAVAIVTAVFMQQIDSGGWAGTDAERFHEMASIIISGAHYAVSAGIMFQNRCIFKRSL
jgi:hypothetical protein